MTNSFYVVIPARFNSTRFPGKLLQDLGGKTVLEHVYRSACAANPRAIFVATDDARIATEAISFGAEVVMTKSDHQTGTDRIAEVVQTLQLDPESIVVNVQGDEPFIAPQLIRQVADSNAFLHASISTLCAPLSSPHDYENPHVVKVVRNRFNQALYFSRSPVPFFRDGAVLHSKVYRHIGLYAYRAQFLLEYVSWPVSDLESFECLEQLRVLWYGHRIQVEEACVSPKQDINTPEDLEYARKILAKIAS